MGIAGYSVDESTAFFLKSTEKAMAVINLQGDIYEVNEKLVTYFGVNSNENIKTIIAQRSLLEFEEIVRQLVPKGSITCDFFLKVQQKHICRVKTNLYFHGETNTIILLFGLPRRDCTNEEENWLCSLDYTDSLLVLSSRSGYIQGMNNLAFEFLNLPESFFIGKKIDALFSLFVENPTDRMAIQEQIIDNEDVEIIQQYIHPTKHVRYYKIEQIKDSLSGLLLLKITDYTQKTLLKQQLSRKNSLLEAGQLAASVAHEIRNPMTTLKGFTQLLKGNANDCTMKYLNVIEGEIERIENILSEMLTLSKPRKLDKKALSLRCLLDNIIAVITPKAMIESVEVVVKDKFIEAPFIVGDEGRLKQVFLNIFKNGLESMQSGGRLVIYIEPCVSNHVNIIITDTGKGIEEQNLSQVFMPYFTTRADGTGLGMPFVLQTVEDHGGTISVSSELGIGTSFMLTFELVEKEKVLYQRLGNPG